jgi:hypothetical protein
LKAWAREAWIARAKTPGDAGGTKLIAADRHLALAGVKFISWDERSQLFRLISFEKTLRRRDLIFLRRGKGGTVRQVRLLAHAAVPVLIFAALSAARAEIQVRGTGANVHLETQEASVAEILTALSQHFDLRIRGAPSDRRVTGTFEGPLRRVAARVLGGCDYVIRSRGAAIEVLVVSCASSADTVAPSPPVPVPRRAN